MESEPVIFKIPSQFNKSSKIETFLKLIDQVGVTVLLRWEEKRVLVFGPTYSEDYHLVSAKLKENGFEQVLKQNPV